MAAKGRYEKSPKIKAVEAPTAKSETHKETPGAVPKEDEMAGTTGTMSSEHHDRHAAELKEMHGRHASEMASMHERHQKEHKAMGVRHLKEAGGGEEEGKGGTEPGGKK